MIIYYIPSMNSLQKMCFASTERLNDFDLIITFNDGRCGLYSSALLYECLAQSEELFDTTEGKDSELRGFPLPPSDSLNNEITDGSAF